jgi:hypothetical protein
MTLRKQIKKLQNFLDADMREREAYREDMKTLLMKLKRKEKQLLNKTLMEFDQDKLARLRKEIDMLHAQRLKGIKALKELKELKELKA